jgi:S-adenosylmethionine:tRNA ribosyltransferase-isomerase
MDVDEFAFDLPADLIAQFPPPQRGQSRLLHLQGTTGEVRDLNFSDLPELSRAGDLLVFNDTRVMKARLFAHKESGGKIEILVERIVAERRVLALIRASHAPRPGMRLHIAAGVDADVIERNGEFYLLELIGDRTALEVMERAGRMPLPPYIERPSTPEDEARYQTVYARILGAVAAPTAGLHFDQPMLDRLHARGVRSCFVTLHVGAGTFQPVRERDIDRHRMHSEWYDVPAATAAAIEAARGSGGRVVAVGTTSLRAIESAARNGALEAGPAQTDLFIRPGYRFHVVDRLITNFHLPRSTLLMLVCAFAGTQNTLRAYRHAVAQRYRFFSYGDAMLVDPADAPHASLR